MSERELLDRFITTNDPDAFRVLVERHGPMVLAVCRSFLTAAHDVEDAFQNTFLILAKRAETVRNGETIAPWLHRVAVRVARKARFKTWERRIRERALMQSQPDRPYPPADHAFVPLVREEVSRLPDRYRLPVTLCYLEGKTNEEAAAQLRCPVGTIKGRLSRARQKLRERLTRLGFDARQTPF